MGVDFDVTLIVTVELEGDPMTGITEVIPHLHEIMIHREKGSDDDMQFDKKYQTNL